MKKELHPRRKLQFGKKTILFLTRPRSLQGGQITITMDCGVTESCRLCFSMVPPNSWQPECQSPPAIIEPIRVGCK